LNSSKVKQTCRGIAIKDGKTTVIELVNHIGTKCLSAFQMPEQDFIGKICPNTSIPTIWYLKSIIILATTQQAMKGSSSDVVM